MTRPLRFEIPIRTSTGLNAREHWGTRNRRVKKEREITHICFRAIWSQVLRASRPVLPVDVLLTRMSPGTRRIDSDNLVGSLKAFRDQIAQEFGVDDGDEDLIRFHYAQEKGPWGVRVSIFEREEAHERPIHV